jgi:chromosome segregation ATPase
VDIHATGRRISPNRRKKLKDGAFPFEESRRDWFRTKDSLQLHIRFRQEPHPMTNEELLTRIETLLDDRFGVVNRQFEIIDGKFKTVDERFDQLTGQFNGLTGQFDGLSHRFDDLSGQVNGLSSRFDQLNNRFDELHAELISTRDVLEARIATLEIRFDKLENRVEAVRVELKKEIRDTRDHLEAEIGRSFSAIIETHRDVKLTRRRVREIEQETLTRIEQLEQRVERLEAELPPQS